MRLILGFIFFGLLFYAIWLYSPETFQILVSWAAKIFDFFSDLYHRTFGHGNATPAPDSPKSLLDFLF